MVKYLHQQFTLTLLIMNVGAFDWIRCFTKSIFSAYLEVFVFTALLSLAV